MSGSLVDGGRRGAVYTAEHRRRLVRELLEHLARGGTMREWASEPGRPSVATVYRWIATDRDVQAHVLDMGRARVAGLLLRMEDEVNAMLAGDRDAQAMSVALRQWRWLLEMAQAAMERAERQGGDDEAGRLDDAELLREVQRRRARLLAVARRRGASDAEIVDGVEVIDGE